MFSFASKFFCCCACLCSITSSDNKMRRLPRYGATSSALGQVRRATTVTTTTAVVVVAIHLSQNKRVQHHRTIYSEYQVCRSCSIADANYPHSDTKQKKKHKNIATLKRDGAVTRVALKLLKNEAQKGPTPSAVALVKKQKTKNQKKKPIKPSINPSTNQLIIQPINEPQHNQSMRSTTPTGQISQPN